MSIKGKVEIEAEPSSLLASPVYQTLGERPPHGERQLLSSLSLLFKEELRQASRRATFGLRLTFAGGDCRLNLRSPALVT